VICQGGQGVGGGEEEGRGWEEVVGRGGGITREGEGTVVGGVL